LSAELCADPLVELKALPQTSYLDLREPTSKEGRGKEGRGREDLGPALHIISGYATDASSILAGRLSK